MNSNLIVHAGGWNATAEQVEAVETPAATETWAPLAHRDFLDAIRTRLPRFGLNIKGEQYALAKDGARMFGVITTTVGTRDDLGYAIGLRNSHDMSFATDVLAGSKVFVCDNLAFNGEVRINRKHTKNLMRDLPALMYDMLDKLVSMKGNVLNECDAMRKVALDEKDVAYLIVQAVKNGAMPGRYLQNVLSEYERPTFEEFTERNAWSLYNAFTYVFKERGPQLQMNDTLRLTQLFRDELELPKVIESMREEGAASAGLIKPDDLPEVDASEVVQ
jgi:hypothetical protein